jgi:hypothetical protein
VDEKYWKEAEVYSHHFLQLDDAKAGGSSSYSLSKKYISSSSDKIHHSSDKIHQHRQQKKCSSGSSSRNRPPVQTLSQQYMSYQQSSSGGGGGRTSQPQSETTPTASAQVSSLYTPSQREIPRASSLSFEASMDVPTLKQRLEHIAMEVSRETRSQNDSPRVDRRQIQQQAQQYQQL